MAENRTRGPSLVALILFVAASTMMLLIAGSMVHYAPTTSAGTLIDYVGSAMPYALFAGLVTYYLLKPRKLERPELRETYKSILKSQAMVLLIAVGVFLGVLYFVFTFIPFPLGFGLGGTEPAPPPVNYTLQAIPILNPGVILTIIMMALVVGALLISTFLRTKAESTEGEPQDETGVGKLKTATSKTIEDEFRRAIIKSYVQGRDVLVDKEIALNESMTPREVEGIVLESAEAARADFVPLTRLFEEARFSIHRVGAPEKTKAEKHYERLAKKSSRQGADES